MTTRQPVFRSPSRGVTLIGLLTWAILVGFIGYVLVRTVPTLLEYYAIQGAVDKLAAAAPKTVAEVRKSFDRQKDIEYSIVSISGDDLNITKENDRVVIGYAYEKEIELIGPVFLLIKYQGKSK